MGVGIEEGIKDLEEKVGETWEAAWVPFLMAKLEIAAGKTDKVADYIKLAQSLGLKDQDAYVNLAEVFALEGRDAEAIDTLKNVLESGHHDPYFLQIYPAFQSLQNDQRFRSLFSFE